MSEFRHAAWLCIWHACSIVPHLLNCLPAFRPLCDAPRAECIRRAIAGLQGCLANFYLRFCDLSLFSVLTNRCGESLPVVDCAVPWRVFDLPGSTQARHLFFCVFPDIAFFSVSFFSGSFVACRCKHCCHLFQFAVQFSAWAPVSKPSFAIWTSPQ